MSIALNLITLRSRKIDVQIKAKRGISRAAGAVGKPILDKLKKIGGWAVGNLLKLLPPLDFSTIWDLVVNAYFELKEFDWNKADKDLEEQIKNNNKALATQAAGAIGRSAGVGSVRLVNSFAGKFFPGNKGKQLAAVEGIKIPVLSQRVGVALAREQGTQLRADTMAFLESATRAMISNGLSNMLLHARRQEWFGMKPVTGPQTDGSINAKIQKKTETLPKDWQQPATAFLEGFESGIIQAGYVIAQESDDYLETLRYAREERLANQETLTIEIWPEDSAPEDEPLRFVGRQDEVIEAAATVLPQHDLLAQPRGYLAPPVQIHSVKGNPQIVFSFVETAASQKRRQGKARKEMRASFRILTERFESASDKVKIDAIALKIRAQFPATYRHVIGAESWVYTDQKHGYALKISSNSQQEARVLVGKLLRCHPDPVAFDNDSFARGRTKSGVTKRQTVLGKSVVVSGPKERVEVSLRQVDLSLPGWGSQLLVYRQFV
jgi:hypothetical protein